MADLSEFWNGQKEIYLLDQNLLAAKERKELLQQLIDSKATIVFDGGMDVRFMSEDIIEMARYLKVKDWHFAWDDPRENLAPKFKQIIESKLITKDRCSVYCLTNFWSNTEQDLHRIYTLRSYGYVPYVMIFDKQKFVRDDGRWKQGVEYIFTTEQLRHFKTCQHLQRWCNNRRLIKSIPNFNDYEPYAKWVANGKPVPIRGGAECK